MPIIQRVLLDAESLRRAGQELQGREEGRLSIGATHSQACYASPHVVRNFRQRYPRVALPCYRWSHSIVVPPGHPLLDLLALSTLVIKSWGEWLHEREMRAIADLPLSGLRQLP